jgi:ABC-type multidrug transport system fused ATPase/permease subunit
MKRRYLYLLLFGVPTFLASVIISLLLFGAVAGALWLFVLGDNPWPSTVNSMLVAMLILACMTLWVAFMSVAYVAGKKQEAHVAMNTKHVVVSAGATALLVLLVVSHQWSVGNIGARSDGLLCSEYCRDKGFVGSGMQPRNTGAATCSCFDAQGREAAKVPMSDVTAEQRK